MNESEQLEIIRETRQTLQKMDDLITKLSIRLKDIEELLESPDDEDILQAYMIALNRERTL